MNFLTGLGSLGGGLASGFSAGLQDAGQIADMQNYAAIGAGLRGLMGGGGQSASATPQAPNVAQAPTPDAIAALNAQQPSTSPTPQTVPASKMPAIPPGQPGIAQPSAQPIQPPPQAQPQAQPQQAPQGTAQLAMQMQPQAQQGQPQGFQGQRGGMQGAMGPLTLPALIQGILRAKPNISDAQLGRAVSRTALPLLNQQGLDQYRQLNGLLREQTLGLGYDRLAQQSQQFSDRESRLEGRGKSLDNYRQQLIESRNKETQARMQERALRDQFDKQANQIAFGGGSDDDKKKALDALRKEYDANLDKIRKGMGEVPTAPKEDAETGGGDDQDVMYDEKGNPHRYKGKGDRKDPANWD